MASNPQLETLTRILSENPEVGERLKAYPIHEWEEGITELCPPNGYWKWDSMREESYPDFESLTPDDLAKFVLSDFPNSFFAEALERVADVVHLVIVRTYCTEERHTISFVRVAGGDTEPPPSADIWQHLVEHCASDSEAVRAAWLALMEKCCEKCERCGGEGKVHWEAPNPEDTQTQQCPHCHGTGKEMWGAEKVLAALIGGSQ